MASFFPGGLRSEERASWLRPRARVWTGSASTSAGSVRFAGATPCAPSIFPRRAESPRPPPTRVATSRSPLSAGESGLGPAGLQFSGCEGQRLLDCGVMSSSQTRPRVADGRVDALPLRSLTALWVALGVLTLALVGVVGRGLWVESSARAAASQPAQPKGPTKRQVRERQEHIALTERALELARKEQKATTAPTPSSSSPATPAPQAASEGSTVPSSKTAASRATATGSPASASAPAASAASDKPAAKPASSGLDAMRADIASQFE